MLIDRTQQGLQESRWNHKSSSKTSRAVQGKTEVIVRHTKAVEETYPGARSQSKNIKAIFIQNHDGERFKYPFIHTAGAFAMAQHVDHGGVPHDPAGKAIIKMSEHIAKLGEFQRHIHRSIINADAHGIAERAMGHMNELKARVAALGKRHHYQAWREEFEASGMGEPADEMMLDAVTLEDYKSKFTQTNFQEELVGFFPLLHSIMRETNTVDLEEYVSEKDVEEGFVGNMIDKAKGMFGKKPAAPAGDNGAYADGSSIKTPGGEDWKQQYQQAVMAVKNAKTQQEYEAASDRAGSIKDLLASKGIQVDPVLGQQGAEEGIHTGDSLQRFRDNPRFNQNEPAKDRPMPQQSEGAAPWEDDVKKLATINPVDRYSAYANIRSYFKDNPELSQMASDLMGGYYEADMLKGKYKTDAAKAKYAELEPMNQEFIKQALGQEQGDEEPPFEPDTKSNFSKPNNPNRTGMDSARALAQRGMSPAESINAFEEWADATEQGKLTDDQIMELKQALSDLQASGNPLQLGPNGQTAIQFFSELGLDDADLKDKLEAATQLDPAGDGVEIMKLWAQESYPELLVALGMSGTGEEQPPEAAPPAPEVGAAPEQPVAEGKSSMVHEVAKIVKSFYNADNESVGPFRAEENIALDCKKQISEKFGEKAGEQAYEMAEAFINKLTQEWQQKHGHIQKHSPVDQGDGFSIDRLKELVGNIKQKVEGMGQPEMEEKDDWHPSRHVTDPQKKKELAPYDDEVERGDYNARARYLDAAGVKRDKEQHEDGPKPSEVPAWKRKEQGKAPLTTQDLEKERNQSRTTQQGLDAHKAKMGMSEELAAITKLAGIGKK